MNVPHLCPHLWLVALLLGPLGAVADNTGPTHPEGPNEHPLDTRPLDNQKPHQDLIDPPPGPDTTPRPGSDDSLPPMPEPPSTPVDPHSVPAPRFEAAGGAFPWPPEH